MAGDQLQLLCFPSAQPFGAKGAQPEWGGHVRTTGGKQRMGCPGCQLPAAPPVRRQLRDLQGPRLARRELTSRQESAAERLSDRPEAAGASYRPGIHSFPKRDSLLSRCWHFEGPVVQPGNPCKVTVTCTLCGTEATAPHCRCQWDLCFHTGPGQRNVRGATRFPS